MVKYINLGNQFHNLRTRSQERGRNISKTYVSIFHHSIQHMKLLVILFIMKLITEINMFNTDLRFNHKHT